MNKVYNLVYSAFSSNIDADDFPFKTNWVCADIIRYYQTREECTRVISHLLAKYYHEFKTYFNNNNIEKYEINIVGNRMSVDWNNSDYTLHFYIFESTDEPLDENFLYKP